MAIYEFEGKIPALGPGTYVAESADVIGDVRIGEGCVVKQNQRIPPGKVAAGVPAGVIGDCSEKAREFHEMAVKVYSDMAKRYAKGLRRKE